MSQIFPRLAGTLSSVFRIASIKLKPISYLLRVTTNANGAEENAELLTSNIQLSPASDTDGFTGTYLVPGNNDSFAWFQFPDDEGLTNDILIRKPGGGFGKSAWSRRDSVYVSDYLAANGNDARLAAEAAIAEASSRGIKRVIFSGGTYNINAPITVNVSNIVIQADSKYSATVAQSVWGLPAFVVTADNVTIANLKIINTTNAKTRITSWVSGYNFGSLYNQRNVQRDYCAGVASINCHATSVVGCEFRDFFSGVTLFGFYNGGSNPQRGLNHRMYDCVTYNCDMGILAYLTDGAIVKGNRGYDIEWTQGSAPPHFGYFSVERNDDGDYTAGDDHYRLTYCENVCSNNKYSSGHKFKAVRESVIYNNIATGCVRGFDVDYCFDSLFSMLTVKDIVDYVWPTNVTHPQYLGTSTLSNQLSYNGGVPYDSQTSGINVVDTSNCQFVNIYVEKGSVDTCDAILLRRGDNGGTNNVAFNSVQISSNNDLSLSNHFLNNAAVTGNLNTLARYKITSVDTTNNAAVLDWSPVSSALPDGTAVTLRTPLSGAIAPTPLVGDTTYYIKQSAANSSAAEFYTDAGMTQRVTLGNTLSGDVYIRNGVNRYVDTTNDCVYVNWNPVTGSIPNGSPVTVRRGTTQSGAALPGGLAENTIYYSKQSAFSAGWVEFHTTPALNSPVDITSVGAGQFWVNTAVNLALTNVGTSTFDFGVTVSSIFADGTPVAVSADNPSTQLPSGLAENTIYYIKSTGTTFNLYTNSALTNLATISSAGTGFMCIHEVKNASGYAINVSNAVNCQVSDVVFRQLGTSSGAQSARPFRFTAGANAFVLDKYKVIGTNRHGQIDLGATNCAVNFNISETDSSANYSSSWVDNSNGLSNTRFSIPVGHNPIGFSSNTAIPTIGIAGMTFQTNSSGSTRDLVGLQGLFWPGRVVKILSADNLTRIAVASVSRAASGNVSTVNDTINLGVPVSSLFADGTPVLVTSSGGPSAVPGGLTSGIPYFIKASAAGANTAEFYTDSALTSKVDITSNGSNTLTIRTTAAQGCQSLSTRAQTNINVTTNEIDLGQSVATLFGNGAAVTVSSSATLPGGLATNTTYYIGTGPSGANFAQLFTNSSLTSLVDITSQGTGNLTIKTPGIGFRLAPGMISWASSRNPFAWIEFTYSSTEGLWVQTGGSSNTMAAQAANNVSITGGNISGTDVFLKAVASNPTAGNIYTSANTLRYRDSSNVERLLLNSADNLSNVANTNTALNNLLPSQSNNAGKVLSTDGTNASWITVSGGGPSGLPAQSGNAGKFLTTNGTDAAWTNISPITSDGTQFRNSANNVLFNISNTNNAANYLQARAGAAGSGVVLEADGVDSNIHLDINSKGTGDVRFNQGRVIIGNSGLVLQGAFISTVTPAGSAVPTKIDITAANPGAFGQMFAVGITSASPTTARVISVFDQRSGVYKQPSLAVFNPTEDGAFGLAWDGPSNIPVIKTTDANGNIGFSFGPNEPAQLFSGTLAQFATPIRLNVNATLELTQGGTPANPPSGYTAIYPKNDNRVYTRNNAGTETRIAYTGDDVKLNTAPVSPAIGDIYRNADTVRYRDSSNTERLLLNSADNLANLASPSTALNNLLPSQSGNSGRYLSTNGTDAAWSQPIATQTVNTTTAIARPYTSYTSDGDANGIIYAIGSNYGSAGYFNPHTLGRVTGIYSSLDMGNVDMLFDRASTGGNIYSSNVANQWIVVDLGATRSAVVTRYSLRNYQSATDMIRNWKLQGSNDVSANTVGGVNAATWVDIDVRASDSTHSGANAWGTWVSNQGNNNSYRWLRILQTGLNSSGRNYLCISEIEFYGTLNLSTAELPTSLFQGWLRIGEDVHVPYVSPSGASLSSALLASMLGVPSQVGNAGRVLQTNGSALSWTDLGQLATENRNTANITGINSASFAVRNVAGETQFSVTGVGSSVNNFDFQGSTTTNAPIIGVVGSDTNIDARYRTKGTGVHRFQNAAGADQFRIGSTSSATNYWQVNGANATNPVLVLAGASTNVGGIFRTKGSSDFQFQNGNSNINFRIDDSGGTTANYISVTGAAAGGRPIIQVLGTDSNVGIAFRTRGTGAIGFQTAGGADILSLNIPASVITNGLRVNGAASSSHPSLEAQGGDNNINLTLTPKGTGVVAISANALQVPELSGTPAGNPPAGTQWIYIKSSDGKLYRKNSAGTETLIGG